MPQRSWHSVHSNPTLGSLPAEVLLPVPLPFRLTSLKSAPKAICVARDPRATTTMGLLRSDSGGGFPLAVVAIAVMVAVDPSLQLVTSEVPTPLAPQVTFCAAQA